MPVLNGQKINRAAAPLDERIHKLSVPTDTGCWEWAAAISNSGYGVLTLAKPRRNAFAHRVSYEAFTGPIPDGMQVDHLCRNRICVNPEHLEAVSPRTNVLRGNTVAAAQASKVSCDHGHEFTPENTYVTRWGRRQCRACNRARSASYRARKAEQNGE